MSIFRWHKSSHRKLAVGSFAAALIPAALLAADTNFLFRLPELIVDICIALSMPGGFVFLILIGGSHVGGNRFISTTAGVIAIFANAFVYFWIGRGIMTLNRKRRRAQL